MKKILVPALLIAALAGVSSCKKTHDCTLIVTVTKDSVDFITGDTSNVPVHHATVEIYSDETGHDETLDLTMETGSNGQAEFVYKAQAIYLVRVTSGLVQYDAGYAVLKEGETVEKPVNLSEF